MTALVDFPITETPDPRDPAVIASLAQTLNSTELQVALHASGSKLGNELFRDDATLTALVEIGLASLGIDAVRQAAARLVKANHAVLDDIDSGGTGVEADKACDRLLGGKRRADRCRGLAFHIIRRRPLPKTHTVEYEYGPGLKRWTGTEHTGMGFPGDTATWFRA